MIRIALSHNIDDNKSVRKRMQMIWDIFCRQIAMTSLPLPMIFLPANTDAEIDFTVSNKEGPYNLLLPPLVVSQIVSGYRKDMFSTDLKMLLLGLLFQELSRRVIGMEYLSRDLSNSQVKEVERKALEIIFTSTNAEIALMAEDEGPPLKVVRLPESTQIIFIFMYTRYKDTLESRGFFDQLIQESWIIC